MIPRINGLRAHHSSYFDVSFGLAKLSNFSVSHFSDFSRLNVKVFTNWLVLVLRVVDEFQTFLFRPSFFFIQEASPGSNLSAFLSVLETDDKFVVIFVKVYLISVFGELLQLLFAPDFIYKNLVIMCVLVILLGCCDSLFLTFISLIHHNFIKRDRLEICFSLRLV